MGRGNGSQKGWATFGKIAAVWIGAGLALRLGVVLGLRSGMKKALRGDEDA